MKIIVQKFGGTSVSNDQRREMVSDRVIEAIKKGYSPVVVVSAIGRKGDPYATDTLLSLINGTECISGKRETDLLMSCGEIISAVVLAETITRRGYKVKVMNGGQAGIITNNNFGNAEIIKTDMKRIKECLNDGIIPIVTGFQGVTIDGDTTTLGRGGSDVTGAILGEALNAECIEIYTDVDGIMTADPRIVKDAKVIDKISYNEVFQLADQGAKVIHPKAVEYAMRGNIPIVIKNTLSDASGTIISSLKNSHGRVITGITHMANRTQVSVYSDGDNNIIDKLAEKSVSIDLINVFPDLNIFTVDGCDTEKVEKILNSLQCKYNIVKNCSKIAIIGSGMHGIPGIMAKILKVLRENDVKLLQTADSHTTIWCLVKGEDTNKAINSLHKAFNL